LAFTSSSRWELICSIMRLKARLRAPISSPGSPSGTRVSSLPAPITSAAATTVLTGRNRRAAKASAAQMATNSRSSAMAMTTKAKRA
jgi:hypothetical protein